MGKSKTCNAPHGSTSRYRFGCRCDECREAKRASFRDWQARNPTWHSDYYRTNRAVRQQKSREWTAANPVKDKLRVERKRAIRRDADIRVVAARDWARLVARYGGRCAYCGEARPLTQDHIVPLSRGGRHSIGNLLPACGSCNFSKGSKLLIEWRSLRLAA